MTESLERPRAMRPIYKEASYIIGQNKEVMLSKEILLQLKRAGLKLIPQLRLET